MEKHWLAFTRVQRKGILMLFLLIMLVQGLLFYGNVREGKVTGKQGEIAGFQKETERLKHEAAAATPKIFPFNPNFITDFKGYKLGMSPKEIDRLLAYRAEGRFVNSASEFQQVTLVHDTLLKKIAPYFKFPDWVNKLQSNPRFEIGKKYAAEKAVVRKADINTASQEELMALYGIGPALSERIMKMREKLGGFVSMEQMHDVWGLSDDVIDKLNERFYTDMPEDINKVRINEANFKELMKFPYFNYNLVKEIMTYRSMNNQIASADDLIKINGFPEEKVKIIALYLEF